MKKQDAATLGYALVFAGLVFWLIKSAKGFWWWVLALFIIAPIGSWIGWALGKDEPVVSNQSTAVSATKEPSITESKGGLFSEKWLSDLQPTFDDSLGKNKQCITYPC